MPLFGRTSEREERRAQAVRQWAQRQNGLAIISLALGIFSLIDFGTIPPFGIAGLACGVIALVQGGDPASPRSQGRLIALVGVVFSTISLVLAAYLYFGRPLTPSR